MLMKNRLPDTSISVFAKRVKYEVARATIHQWMPVKWQSQEDRSGESG